MMKQIKSTRLGLLFVMILFIYGQASAGISATAPSDVQQEQVETDKKAKKIGFFGKKKPKTKEKKNRKGFWRIVGGSVLNTFGGIYVGRAFAFLSFSPMGSAIAFVLGVGMLIWGTSVLMKGIRKHVAAQKEVDSKR